MPSLETLVEDQPDIGQVIEDNISALLDTVGVKNADDIEEDKLSFLEAVYALCIAGTQPKAPTWRVHTAVFRLLEGNSSMVLNVASYSVLVEILQQYPHILVKEHPCNGMKKELILNNKIWSPFRSYLVVEEKGRGGVSTRQASHEQQYWEDFVHLLEEIQRFFGEQRDSEASTKTPNYKTTGLILKFNYLFKILEQDFECRFQVYKDVKKEEIMSSCYLVHLFDESRKKSLLELLFNLIASSSVSSKCRDEFLDLQEFSLSLQALVEMRLSLELESMRMSSTSTKKSRADAKRGQSMTDLFTDIFHFNKDLLKTLLQVMEDSDCKWRIIFADFLKSVPKPLASEKINDPNNVTAQELLNCLYDVNSAKIVLRVMDSDMLQFYLASAFKVGLRQTKSDGISTPTLKLCESLKMAFQNLQSVNKDFYDLHPIAKQALITAETLIMLAN